MKTIKVLIADDHALIREGLGKILSLEPKIQVVGEAVDGEDALKKVRELQPEVVLMDLNMPVIDGIEASLIIRKDMPSVKIIALTVHTEEERIFDLIRAGIAGYILKDVEPEGLINTIQAVAAGETVINPKITAKLLSEVSRLNEAAATAEERETVINLLTTRELEILRLIANGHCNKSIADILCISEKTVKNHISSIFRKIKVEDRTQAAVFAIKTKLVHV